MTNLNSKTESLAFMVELPQDKGLFEIDLTEGLNLFTHRFLSSLRNALEYEAGRGLGKRAFEHRVRAIQNLITTRVMGETVDFLSAKYLTGYRPVAKKGYLRPLRSLLKSVFKTSLRTEVFDKQFSESDLLLLHEKVDSYAKFVKGVIEKAMSAPAYAGFLQRLQGLFANGEIPVGSYAYLMAQICTNTRQINLWPCKVSDLEKIEGEGLDGQVELGWALRTYIGKTRVNNAKDKGTLQPIPLEVGNLLDQHRKVVLQRYAKYFRGRESEISLFPLMYFADHWDGLPRPQGIRSDWLSEKAQSEFRLRIGRPESSMSMHNFYMGPIESHLGEGVFGAQVIRHTIATYLAGLGFDARTIGIMLQHSNAETARAYVDIHFHGLLDEFGASMEEQTRPILAELLQRAQEVVSGKSDEWHPSQLIQVRIDSHDGPLTTGACKANPCRGAPYQCYVCPTQSFIPFFEADHQALIDELVAFRDSCTEGSSSLRLEAENIQTWIIRITAVEEACKLHRTCNAIN